MSGEPTSFEGVIRGRARNARKKLSASELGAREGKGYTLAADEASRVAKHRQEEQRAYEAWRDNPEAAKNDFPPVDDQEQPQWVRDLYTEARFDAELAKLLEGTGGNPTLIKWRMQRDLEDTYAPKAEAVQTFDTLKVSFQTPLNLVNLWVWVELPKPPTGDEKELLSALLASWFAVGRSGGYNALNQQCQNAGAAKLGEEGFKYDRRQLVETLPGRFHAMAPEVEYKGRWARCWFDLGTADELGLDVLVNMLAGLGEEFMSVRRVVVGGDSLEIEAEDDDDEEETTTWDGRGVYRSDLDRHLADPNTTPSAAGIEFDEARAAAAADGAKGRLGLRVPVDRETGRMLMDARPAWEDEEDNDFDAKMWQQIVEEEEARQMAAERGEDFDPLVDDLEKVQMGIEDYDEDLVGGLGKDDLRFFEPGSQLLDYYESQQAQSDAADDDVPPPPPPPQKGDAASPP